MARRSPSPTQLVVDYFMNGELASVEQALVIASSIVSNRRARETSVALTAPARRPRVRARKPAATPPAAAAATPAPVAIVAPPAAVAASRRRSRAAAPPAEGQPARKRGRPAGSKTTGATPPLPSSGPSTSAAPAAAEPPPLPDQGVLQGDEV